MVYTIGLLIYRDLKFRVCGKNPFSRIFQNSNKILQKFSEKELSLFHKLYFSKSYIFGFQCRRPQIFQTMNSVRSNNVSLKYHRFTTLCSKDIGIINSQFVAKTQFLLGEKSKRYLNCDSIMQKSIRLANSFL